MNDRVLNVQRQRYKYLAYVVLRDAVAFYFGIPLFLGEDNLKIVFSNAVRERLQELKLSKGRPLTQKEINRCIQTVRKSLSVRIKELEEDLVSCENIIFHDNIWLNLLDVNENFFEVYLSRLNSDAKRALAVIPKWGTRDHSLGRTYINDSFNIGQGF